jgi:hypothetical protein
LTLGRIFVRWGIPLTAVALAALVLTLTGVFSRLAFAVSLLAILAGYWVTVAIVLRRARRRSG